MTRVLAWLTRTTFGVERWRLLVCAVVAALVAWALGWPGGFAGLLALVRPRPRQVDWSAADRPDPGPDALDAHRAALEVDRARRGVEQESAAREAAGVRAAAEDPIDDVRRRVEARAREHKP